MRHRQGPRSTPPTSSCGWGTAIELARLVGYTLHDLRHTFASALIRQGRSVKYVQIVVTGPGAVEVVE